MRNFLIISIIISLFSCKEDEKTPDYVWSEERFTEVLTEFQMMEAIIRLGYHRTEDSIIVNDSMYNAVFRKMNTNRVEFDSNYNYYLKDPELLEKIYDNVIIKLSERSAELETVGKQEKTLPDSSGQSSILSTD